MKAPLIGLLSIVCALVAAACLTVDAGRAEETPANSEVEAVLAANEKFYAALNAMLAGDAEPFADVWWHTDDVVYMGADGAYNVGWKQTFANWKKQAALNIGGEVKATDIKVSVGDKLALVTKYVVRIGQDDSPTPGGRLRATSVFRKDASVWKLISHHVDVVPPLRERMDEQ